MSVKLLAGTAIGLACLVSSAACAQDVAAQPVAPAEANAPAVAVVPKGTLIVVVFPDLISTRTAARDDMFNLTLAEPVMLNGTVVIPAGTPGKGQVIEAAKPGMGGKPGKLVLSARYLEFDGKQIPIRALNMSYDAKDNSGAALATSVVVGVFGLAVTGGHMEVPAGSRAQAKLGADFAPAAASSSTQNDQ